MLTKSEIQKQMLMGNISIENRKENAFNKPNSCDLRLSDDLYSFEYEILDARNGDLYLQEALTGNINALKKEKFTDKGFLLQPHKVYLARTIEHVTTHGFIPVIYGKANLSMLGVSIELTNGYKTDAFDGHMLLTIIATKPTIIYPGVDIANLAFFPSLNTPYACREIDDFVSCGLYASGMLSGAEIKARMLGENPDIIIDKQDLVVFNPNSVNLSLYDMIGFYPDAVLDIKEKNAIEVQQIPKDGMFLYPDEIYVARTNEWTETNNLVPMMSGRSSLGRNGIHVHCSAGFGSIGYKGYWHLGIRVVKPIFIKSDMKCCQIYYMTAEGDIKETYNGYMQNMRNEDVGSRMHLIMKNK